MSMRLNESIRSAFVNAVLNDTPKVDYAEQRRKIIQDHLFAIAPAAILRVYKDQDLRRFLRLDHVSYETAAKGRMSWGLGKYWLVPDSDHTYRVEDKETLKQLHAIDALEIAQVDQRTELEKKLRATILAFNTVKQARDALPEFVKYLPDEADPKCKTLPAITDLVTDLVKAGWPDKGKKNAKAKTA